MHRLAADAGTPPCSASVPTVSRMLRRLLGRPEPEARSSPVPSPRNHGVQGATKPDEQCQAYSSEPPPLPDELVPYDPPYEWCDAIEGHKRNEQYDTALAILDKCILVEEFHTGEVAPWFYEQAAIIFRKIGDRDGEIAVLRRFAAQPHAAGALPPKLLARLSKLEDEE